MTTTSCAQTSMVLGMAKPSRSVLKLASYRALTAAKTFNTSFATRAMQTRTSGPGFTPPSAYQTDSSSPSMSANISEVDFDPALTNSVNFIGNVGRKPELRFFQDGKKLATSSIAVKVTKDETQWVDIDAWNELGEAFADQIDKGQRISVQGRLRIQDWTDREGVKRKSVKIVANSINKVRYTGGGDMMGGNNNNYNGDSQQQSNWGQLSQQQQPVQSGFAQQSFNARPAQQQQQSAAPAAAQLTTTEELWMSFFENPEAWVDNREKKGRGDINRNSPDFKKKEGGRDAPALWIEGRSTPLWVQGELQKIERIGGMGDVPPF